MPGQDPRREVGRVDDAVAHDEDVLAGAVGDEAFRREQDRLVVAGVVRLGHGEHRVEVDARRLRGVRDDVRRHALPGRDLRPDARLQALLTEVRRPRPAHDHDLDRIAPCSDTELAVAVEGDRPEVALGQTVRADQLVARSLELLDAERDLHVEELRRVVEALKVLAETEDGRPLRVSRSSGSLRRRRCRSAVRARRRGPSRRPSRRARRSSRSFRSPAPRALLCLAGWRFEF